MTEGTLSHREYARFARLPLEELEKDCSFERFTPLALVAKA